MLTKESEECDRRMTYFWGSEIRDLAHAEWGSSIYAAFPYAGSQYEARLEPRFCSRRALLLSDWVFIPSMGRVRLIGAALLSES